MTALLTMDEAAKRLHYDPLTGIFTWLVKPSAKVRAGDVAGKVRRDGYRVIKIEGQYWYAHRLAWFLAYGHISDQLDHINGDRDDNRLANLREANASQNTINQKRRSDNLSGFKGVYLQRGRNRWRARIRADGQVHDLGYFDTAEEAHQAYSEAAARIHGLFARSE
jgi:hypothetical protein